MAGDVPQQQRLRMVSSSAGVKGSELPRLYRFGLPLTDVVLLTVVLEVV